MQTNFTLAQLADPALAETDTILRACVHCGFCTATCPTYVLTGDELDGPRGRIYLMKDMLERDVVEPATVAHLDRCLTCLSCMTTCPSFVHYMHLVDHARAKIAREHRRPLWDAAFRKLLAFILPSTERFRWAMGLARSARFIRRFASKRLKAALDLASAPPAAPTPVNRAGPFPATGRERKRVVLVAGCVQGALRPSINEAAVRLLNRLGVEVIVAEGCCGALTHHLGESGAALRSARKNIAAWLAEAKTGALDAILVTASGCGTHIKDYGHMLQRTREASAAQRVSVLARDICEFLAEIGLARATGSHSLTVAYHSACSMQHGQKIVAEPRALLADAGFNLVEITEGHLCCGSAGVYNILEPDLASALAARKAGNIDATGADVVATGNIGCIVQLADKLATPIVHTVELLDWATGGPEPEALARIARKPALP